MSADNGVYILVTRGRKVRRRNGSFFYRKQYRVVHAQAIENIAWQPDYPFGTSEQADSPNFFVLNREEVLSYFGEARIITDRKIAEGYAQAIFDDTMKDFGIVEYGIAWLEYPHIPFPRKEQSQQRPSQRRTRRRRLASVS